MPNKPKKHLYNIRRMRPVQQVDLQQVDAQQLPVEVQVHGASGSGMPPLSFYGASTVRSRYSIMAQAIEDQANADFEGFEEEQQLPPVQLLQLLPPQEDEIIIPAPLRLPDTLLLQRKALLANNQTYRESLEVNLNANNEGVGMGFIPIQTLIDIAKKMRCPDNLCMELDMEAIVDVTHIQLDTKIEVTCQSCNQILHIYDPVKRINDENLCPGTSGVVDQCMATGSGHIGAQRFAFGANLAGHLNTYQWEKYSRIQGRHSLAMHEQHLPIVNKCVRDAAHERGVYSDDDGIMDMDVSYDGTWLTRGHGSNLGMGFVIDANTGFVLDHNVLSRFCQACDRIKKKHADNPDECLEAMVAHKDRGECLSNYNGLSGGMEKESALRMWGRSVEKNSMRYTQFISDGDSSAYNAVRELDPYDGVEIEKLECINHVQKRLGTRLRKLKKETFTEIKNVVTGRTIKRSTLGGQGKLTDMVIDRLTGYYGAGIRRAIGTTVGIMKRACLSGVKHVTSTDDNPEHEYCPEGEDSYCFYNKALATNQTPPSHSTMKVRCTLDAADKQKVMNIYEDLTSDELLKKCLSGNSQNPNESIHQKVWSKLSKTKHYGLKTAEYSAAQTVVEHNLGYDYAMKHGKIDFGIENPNSVRDGSQRRDKERVRHSVTPKPKKRRYANAPQADDDYGPGDH